MTPKEQGSSIARQLSDALNKMGSEDEFIEGFVEELEKTHRTLQGRMGVLVLQCLLHWAEMHDNGWHDARNQSLCDLSAKLREVMRDENVSYKRKNDEPEKAFLPFI